MSKISVLGIDLAKNVFQLHGVDEKGKIILQLNHTNYIAYNKFCIFAKNLLAVINRL